jgi:hypothetical protein
MQHKKCVHFLPYRILTNQYLPANIMCCKDEIHIDKSVKPNKRLESKTNRRKTKVKHMQTQNLWGLSTLKSWVNKK